MGARSPIHDAGAGNGRGKRQPRGDALGNTHNVGFEAGVISSPPLACPAHAALHFISYEKYSMPPADALQLPQEFSRPGNVSSFALDWLRNDRSHFLRVDNFLEEFALNELSAVGAAFLRRAPVRAAVRIRIRNMENTGQQAPKS